jgi:molybdopterin converting factor small subunit
MLLERETMKVLIRSVGLVKQLLGQGEFDMAIPEGTDISGLLRIIVEEKSAKMAPYAVEPKTADGHLPVRVIVNGRDIQSLGGRFTVLEDGDEALIFVPIAGG